MTKPTETTLKTYHFAAKVNAAGGVSALCYRTPRAIDLTKASWTNRKKAVTCKACLALLAAGEDK
jgi:hypothetical protein